MVLLAVYEIHEGLEQANATKCALCGFQRASTQPSKKRKTTQPTEVVDLTAAAADDMTANTTTITAPNAFAAMMASAKTASETSSKTSSKTASKTATPAFEGKSYYLMLKVKLDERAKEVVQMCRDAVSEGFWRHNEQFDYTLHFSLSRLGNGKKARQVFEAVKARNKAGLPTLPVVKLAGFYPWPCCVAFKPDSVSAAAIMAALNNVLEGIAGTVKEKESNLHLSLYRRRSPTGVSTMKARCADIYREVGYSRDYGKAYGTSIVIHEVRGDY
eukprot:CAMPEP_0197557924 /NCGR_PEP_ID=MMETSP1320-20131121/18018_1 /TAXON_ID=91990 /ORGANISM="Bolidomonas sp., Strain RCC2347" /LENGTH=272 /DNA_ID=CAMNT_0043119189 /DNA_START=102 /DNA_END=918 /DNA_ORIENTATION=+